MLYDKEELMRRSTSVAAAMVLMLAGGIAACGSGDPAMADRPAPGTTPTGSANIEVRNNHGNEVEMFVWVENQRQRLGTVMANQSERFNLPLSGPTRIRLEYRFSMGPRCESGEVFAQPGERVPITIPSDLGMFPPCS
jgi:hypothetical protein